MYIPSYSESVHWKKQFEYSEIQRKKQKEDQRVREKQLKTQKGQRNFQRDHGTRSANDIAAWRREQEYVIYTHFSVENKGMGKAPSRTLRKRITDLYKLAVENGYDASEATFREHKPHRTNEPTNNIEKLGKLLFKLSFVAFSLNVKNTTRTVRQFLNFFFIDYMTCNYRTPIFQWILFCYSFKCLVFITLKNNLTSVIVPTVEIACTKFR